MATFPSPDLLRILPHELIRSLRELDHALAPHGLYAAAEIDSPGRASPSLHVEWTQALRPCLQRLGLALPSDEPQFRRKPVGAVVRTHGPAGALRITVLKVSAIKVRPYGSAHHVDRLMDHRARWAELEMESRLPDLTRVEDPRWDASRTRLLILLGFAKNRSPFGREIEGLATLRDRLGLDFTSQAWTDPHQRGFMTLAACWDYLATECPG